LWDDYLKNIFLFLLKYLHNNYKEKIARAIRNLLENFIQKMIKLNVSKSVFAIIILLLFLQTFLAAQSITSCSCWQTRDNTFSVVPFTGGFPPPFSPDYRNDDGTKSITLPFNFCFYGTTFNSCYINNNGNITFGLSYTTFGANFFPDASHPMVAPFFADVDTRAGGSGLVYYKLTPTYLIVQWDGVGYFNSAADKVNTFQLIITDGTDPIISGGNNISFCYKDMQWTSSNSGAQGGTNGFGGSPATVGFNKGDGVSYFQLGRFDHAGNSYDGPFNNPDGIDWLDNQSFVLNSCNSSNIPPIVNGFSLCQTDTIKICEYDTLNLPITFQSPELNQTTTASVSASGVNGFSIISNASGNAATITTQLIGGPNNLGNNTITFSGTDDGTPVQTTTFSVVVQVNPAPASTFTVTSSPSVCIGANSTIAYTGSGPLGATYNWNFGGGTIISGSGQGPYTVNWATAGTHYITLDVTANGCKSLITTDSVIVNSSLVANAGNDVSYCSGGTVVIGTTPSAGCTYLWSPSTGLSNNTISNPNVVTTNSGTSNIITNYSITVTNTSCSATDAIQVTIYPSLTAYAGTDVTMCNGDNTTLNASGGTSYVWNPASSLSNPNSSNPVANPTSSATYTVTVADANGCSNTDAISITINSVPTAYAGPNINTCFGFNTTLNASGGSSYSWIPSSGLSNPNISNPIANPTSTTTYTLSVTGANGCSDTATMNITVNSLPVANISSQTNINCFGGSSGSVSVTVTAGNLPYTYLWNNTQTTSTSTGLSAGNYSLSVTDANGCAASQTVTITQPTALSISTFQNNISCNGMSNGSILANVSGGTAGFSYLWSNGQTAAIATGLSAGNYSVTATDANGCTITSAATITEPAVLSASLTSTNATCGNNDGTALSAATGGSGSYSYSWNTSPQQTSPNATGLIPGTIYTVTITDGNGCTMTNTISIGLDPPPVANVSGTTVVCIGDNAVLTASGGLNYSWSNGATTTSITVAATATATYTVTAINGNCFDDTTITVNVNPLPIANAGADTTIMQFQSATLNGSGGINYQWSPSSDLSCSNCPNPTASPMTTTTYMVTVTDANGCTSSATVTVIVKTIECPDPYLPNAFSPNGDGDNDVLKIYNKVPQCIQDLKLVIFNRYGEKIYETTDPAFEWNGVYNRGLLAGTSEAGTEVFVYYLQATVFPNNKINKKGNISLVR